MRLQHPSSATHVCPQWPPRQPPLSAVADPQTMRAASSPALMQRPNAPDGSSHSSAARRPLTSSVMTASASTLSTNITGVAPSYSTPQLTFSVMTGDSSTPSSNSPGSSPLTGSFTLYTVTSAPGICSSKAQAGKQAVRVHTREGVLWSVAQATGALQQQTRAAFNGAHRGRNALEPGASCCHARCSSNPGSMPECMWGKV